MSKNAADKAPESIDVPTAQLGSIIGKAGCIIKRLIESTRCKIEIPRRVAGEKESENTVVALIGTDSARELAYSAIQDILNGGEVEDHAASAEGAMVMCHNLPSRDRESWLAWRMIPIEAEFTLKVEVGRRNVRIWSKSGHLTGDRAKNVRTASEKALEEANQLAELTVQGKMETEPRDNIPWDGALLPLVEMHGVLLSTNMPEDGLVPIKICGPEAAAKNAAQMIEERYVCGHRTGSILQAIGQLDKSLCAEAMQDLKRDLGHLEREFKVKVHQSSVLVWMASENAEMTVEEMKKARVMLREMLQFYVPEGFHFKADIHKSVVDRLMADERLRFLKAKPGHAVAFDNDENALWFCGPPEGIKSMSEHVEHLIKTWEKEYWEMDLEDMGQAYWLLGPRGSGDYLMRMQGESGSKIKVCPNNLKVTVQGKESAVIEGKKLIKEALERLVQKKKEEEAAETDPNGVPIRTSDKLPTGFQVYPGNEVPGLKKRRRD